MALPPAEILRRLPRLVLGLVLFGFGIALILVGDLGVPPWDVFHQGVARHTPVSIGTVMIIVGALLVVAMLALREPIGIGTLLNVLVIGLVVDATMGLLGRPEGLVPRLLCTLGGPFVVALGSGFYLGVRLGPGPRDGLMTALARRGVAVWKARTGVESTVFLIGVLLGGSVHFGTLWFLLTIGPAVQVCLRHLAVPTHEAER